MSEELETLRRQLSNLVRLATVTDVDYELARVKVKYLDNETGWIAWTTARAGQVRTWSPPSIGEQVVMLCPNGSTEQALCILALFKNDYPPPSVDGHLHMADYPDGAIIGYNDQTHTLYALLPDNATTELTSMGGVQVKGDIAITGNVAITGDMTATGNVSDGTRSMDGDRSIFNGHTHTGNMGSPTSPPQSKQ